MVQSIAFPGKVKTFGGARKIIELPTEIKTLVPFGNYQIIISMLGTLRPS